MMYYVACSDCWFEQLADLDKEIVCEQCGYHYDASESTLDDDMESSLG